MKTQWQNKDSELSLLILSLEFSSQPGGLFLQLDISVASALSFAVEWPWVKAGLIAIMIRISNPLQAGVWQL